jgi:DNA helicase-2/ATP-dependent DNA helicase PcrA
MLGVISRFKNDLTRSSDISQETSDYFTQIAGRIYAAYDKVLARNNAMDFDDLLLKTAYLLQEHPEVRQQLSERFQYLLVDEYQDTNHAQYQIAKGLALAHGNICVTGDPDQSIYRWRGADIANILAFEKDWPDAVIVKLEENFRSSGKILSLADKLISVNTKRKEKSLIPTRPEGDDVVIEVYDNAENEASGVAGRIRELIDAGVDLNEIAVFYRVNSMSRPIEEAFVSEQIPYQVVRGMEFYSRKEIRDMLGYLKLIVNGADNAAFIRAMGTHPRGIGKTTIDRLAEYASAHMIGLYEAAGAATTIEMIAKPTRAKLVAFHNMIEGFKKVADSGVGAIIEAVFAESGLEASLRAGGEKGQSAVENINELITSAAKYDSQAEEGSLLDWLQMVALYSDSDAYDAEVAKVSLMTLHAAKGLEFDNVLIIGLEEGLLPHERSSVSDDELEEERRLFFVGMTRARNNLNICYAKYRMIRGQFLRTIPSKFLYEIGYSPQASYESDFADDFTDDDSQIDGTSTEKFRVNELVSHSKFGTGRVKEFLDLGPNSIVVVTFSTGKTKSLMVKYAKLTRAAR